MTFVPNRFSVSRRAVVACALCLAVMLAGCGIEPYSTVRISGTTTYLSARSYHNGGVNALFGDGSVHFIANSNDITAWRIFGTLHSG